MLHPVQFKMLKMDKSRHYTRIWFCLVVMAVISVPQRVISMPCTGSANGQTVNVIKTDRAAVSGSKSMGVPNAAPTVASLTSSAIKKDLFMSRGWGAGGMPFSMFYLNHYTKAQKAQNQQQQQQQQQQTQQQEQSLKQQQLLRIQEDRSSAGSVEDTTSKDGGYPLALETVPLGNGYAPEPNAVHAQQLRTDTDYVDSTSSVRTTKVNTSRRQYTVPQLFVSYGWGPLG